MGESACLRRSFSHPSESSREAKEGDSFRALGESISFGRFMSESLAWEKWSAFSHNRYLEEVERFSKPGSVAEKKAYFEAHYKRKAAERAAALLEATNVVATSAVDSMTEDKNRDKASMDTDLAKGESHVDEQLEKDLQNTHNVYGANANGCNSSVRMDKLDVSNMEGEEVVIQESIDLEKNCNPVEILKQSENNEDHNKIDSTIEENILSEEASGQEIITSRSKKRLSNSSPKISSKNKASKILFSPTKQVTRAQNRNVNNLASRSKNFEQDLADKMSAKSLHMSIRFSSRTGESSKTTSPVIQKIISSKNLTASFNVSKNNSISSQTKPEASINGILKRPLINLKSEDRSTRPLLNKSVAGGITADEKLKNPTSADNSNSSNGKGSKPRSSIISSPFSFRSEERAAKRKEFYQKLEEKRNAEEAEKKHLQTRCQGKAIQDVKKVRQSTVFKAKPNEELYSGSQLPASHIKKIPFTRPRSPILVRKATHSKTLGASSRNSANSKTLKCFESNRSANCSVASRFQKNARENASPNIQSSELKR